MKRDLVWWYWLFTGSLLGAGLFGWAWGLPLAIVLGLVQIGHVLWITRNPAAMALQVRLVYLAILIAGLYGPLTWFHWAQLVATAARVLVGYCFLARTLSLAPWNRSQPLTWPVIRDTYLASSAAVRPCEAGFRRVVLEGA
ncbi:MAG TPA: hypothetical protein VFS39_09040 [Nitrospira sp.]|nr:hypothetical protein [Nitrospira sp.]